MQFPSIWLLGAGFLAFSVLITVIQQRAIRKDPLHGMTGSSSALMAFAGYALTAWTFFSLTGSIQWRYAAIAAVLHVFGSVVVAAIYLMSNMPASRRATELSILQAIMFRIKYMFVGCLFGLVVLAISGFYLFQAYRTAEHPDVSQDILFETAIWTFTWPWITAFVTQNFSRAIRLWSKETARQLRVQTFANSFRDYVVAAWGAAYPFYAFRSAEFVQNERWLAVLAAVFIGAFIVFVLGPYTIGRVRFQRRQQDVLERLVEECARARIATEASVSESYQREALDRTLANLKSLFRDVVEGREFFRFLASKSGRLWGAAEPREGDQADAPAQISYSRQQPQQSRTFERLGLRDPGRENRVVMQLKSWELIYENHLSILPRLDHRLFLLAAIERMLSYWREPASLRAAAAEVALDAEKWRTEPNGRSGVLAGIGLVASALIPVGARAFEPEVDYVIDASVHYARQVFGVDQSGAADEERP